MCETTTLFRLCFHIQAGVKDVITRPFLETQLFTRHHGVSSSSSKEAVMTIDRLVLVFAGSFILISLLLSQIHSSYWLLFTAFVGANLLQSAFTGFCPLAKILKFLGFTPGTLFP
jgi:hypothetical protein